MNITEQLAITARNNPGKTAYVFNDEETSYTELDRAVTKFASRLQQLGYKKGDHIALAVGNSPYYVIGLYGALRLGAVAVPINPQYTASELEYILKNGDVKGIITMDVLLEKFEAISGQLPGIEHYICCESGANSSFVDSPLHEKLYSFSKLVEEGSLGFEQPVIADGETAIVLYTSGTTGKPKGAMLTHKISTRMPKILPII